MVAALALSACSGSSEPRAAPASTSGTPTTSTSEVALASAKEACRLGSGTRTGVDSLRTALALRGEDTSGLTNDAVLQRWVQLMRQTGDAAAFDLLRTAEIQDADDAADATAGAAALDPRWEQLHQGLSNYASYARGRGRGASPAGLDRWTEDIRLGCERVRALASP